MRRRGGGEEEKEEAGTGPGNLGIRVRKGGGEAKGGGSERDFKEKWDVGGRRKGREAGKGEREGGGKARRRRN